MSVRRTTDGLVPAPASTAMMTSCERTTLWRCGTGEVAGIGVWLDGGWVVDALLGVQTRPHSDVDIVVEQKAVPRLRSLPAERGFGDVERDDTSAWNCVLSDSVGNQVDVHAIVFDGSGVLIANRFASSIRHTLGSA